MGNGTDDFQQNRYWSLPIALLLGPIFDRSRNRIFVIRMIRDIHDLSLYKHHLDILTIRNILPRIAAYDQQIRDFSLLDTAVLLVFTPCLGDVEASSLNGL